MSDRGGSVMIINEKLLSCTVDGDPQRITNRVYPRKVAGMLCKAITPT